MTDIPIPVSLRKFQEKVETTAFMTIYELTGPEDQVRKRVEELFDRWHPLGYGTRVVLLSPEKTIVARYNSCE